MTDSNRNPPASNYVPGVGRLTTGRYSFQAHVDGAGFRHQAGDVDLFPTVIIGGDGYTNLQSALQALAATTVVPTVQQATIGTATANLGVITLGGDVQGTALFPKVTGLQNRSVSSVSPTTGFVLTWNGTQWSPAAPTIPALGGDLSGNSTLARVTGLQNNPIQNVAPTTGQYLGWNGTQWTPSTVTSVALGGDLSGTTSAATVTKLRGNAISATAPVASQFLIENSSATGSAWTSISGDLRTFAGEPGLIYVSGLQGYPISLVNPTANQLLQWNGAAWTPTTLPPDNLVGTNTVQNSDAFFYNFAFNWGSTFIFYDLQTPTSIEVTTDGTQLVNLTLSATFFNSINADMTIIATVARNGVDLFAAEGLDYPQVSSFGYYSWNSGGYAGGGSDHSALTPMTFAFQDLPAAGTYTYSLQVSIVENVGESLSDSVGVTNSQISALLSYV